MDTEVSYVMNRANLEQYRGYGFRKVEIINLDVNTCDKCKALEGEVFSIIDAPVLPIHPRCHCSYCIPEGGDEAEITASRGNLDEVYARKGVKGYENTGIKTYSPKGAKAIQAQPIPASKLQAKVDEALNSFERPEVKLEKAVKADEAAAAVSLPAATPEPETKVPKTPENTGVLGVSVLPESAESGIIETEEWNTATFKNERAKAKHEKHLAEYGAKSFEEYEQGARELLAAPLSEDVEGFKNNAGALYKYRKSTNDFVIGKIEKEEAYILTRFKPTNGMAYWKGEMERERIWP